MKEGVDIGREQLRVLEVGGEGKKWGGEEVERGWE